ncbi:hypothetical protein O181_017833 [Austropuccinia psidii MF-1]|uniref:Uncharacterized protein n=1 Tax=Austropuccinia psidii MF-1 TaxID=1389203 RepID=A0A9Q3GS52_9BASI|nr:hypothetical protein [Austropuccinia psidii MF-1]
MKHSFNRNVNHFKLTLLIYSIAIFCNNQELLLTFWDSKRLHRFSRYLEERMDSMIRFECIYHEEIIKGSLSRQDQAYLEKTVLLIIGFHIPSQFNFDCKRSLLFCLPAFPYVFCEVNKCSTVCLQIFCHQVQSNIDHIGPEVFFPQAGLWEADSSFAYIPEFTYQHLLVLTFSPQRK